MGEERADFRTALLLSKIVNIARTIWGKKGIELSTPGEFMIEWDKEEEEIEEVQTVESKKQTVEQMKGMLYAIAGAFGKKVKRRKNEFRSTHSDIRS